MRKELSTELYKEIMRKVIIEAKSSEGRSGGLDKMCGKGCG